MHGFPLFNVNKLLLICEEEEEEEDEEEEATQDVPLDRVFLIFGLVIFEYTQSTPPFSGLSLGVFKNRRISV